jgi:hypothetical protein
VCHLWHPFQLQALAGQEHGRTIPLPVIGRIDDNGLRRGWKEVARSSTLGGADATVEANPPDCISGRGTFKRNARKLTGRLALTKSRLTTLSAARRRCAMGV